jgi:UDP-glucose 4-epimerase
MSDPSGDVSSNLLGSVNLLQECVDKKVKKIVFISSGGTVYGIPKKLPINENAGQDPICAYGITKLAIEKYLEMYRVNYGLEYSILRPSNTYGPRQDPFGNVGAITLFIKNAIENKKIVVWGDGSIIRDYIFASDVAEGIFKGSLCKQSNIFNLGSSHGISLNELIEDIKRKLSIEFEVEYQPTRNYDVPQIYLDISRARELLNWEPKVSLNDGIQLTYDFLKKIIL